MKYSKTRTVKDLTRGTTKAAGIDFYVPEMDDKFIEDMVTKNPKNSATDLYFEKSMKEHKTISLVPHERILIPSGIKVSIPDGHMLLALNKSGVSSKKGLDILACVIDEDYQGEVHLSLVNTSNDMVNIGENEKLVQCAIVPVNYEMPILVPFEELYLLNSERGEAGFGHTDHEEIII